MNNQIQTIWLDPEYESWKNIYHNLVPRKVYLATARVAVAVLAAAADKPKLVLEYICNWNMTWWQNENN